MLAPQVAHKYAHALFLSAKDKGLIDRAYEQFGDLSKLLAADATLLDFLNAPQVLDEHKLELVRKVFEPRLDRLFVEFLAVLVEKHRAGFLPGIIDEFTRLVEVQKGIGRATVLTATPLGEDERRRLTERLAAKTGLSIVLEEKIDLSIIGGMVVLLHDEIIDGSIRHGLDLLQEQLTQVKVV
ncbi:MAG TPA: ATP synthase F1 subunit delta [Candidatus Deferrimicrobium sp.]|nr:ATP synthase F1 subunit delta [Candidatus Deferrimicrobium sp.]